MRSFFFFNDTATTEIYTLSLHDALPISRARNIIDTAPTTFSFEAVSWANGFAQIAIDPRQGTKSRSEEHTLNSSHSQISYAVFCLKKKTAAQPDHIRPPSLLSPACRRRT